MNKKIKYQFRIFIIGFIAIYTLLGILYFKDKLTQFPSNIHAWTQSDRYALALGYVDNNLDLFYPATYNLRPDPYSSPETEEGITAVDLPIHEYIVAIIMKVTGSKAPIVFRLYHFIYGMIGIFFLSLLAFRSTNNLIAGLITGLFAFFSPVYFYYLGGFIPSITSISSVFIGLYFVFLYLKKNENKQLYTGFFFFTLAVIPRFSFVIFLLGLVLMFTIKTYKRKKIVLPEVIASGISMLIIIILYIWKMKLAENYGSGFLSKVMPPDSLKDFHQNIFESTSRWKFHYFSKAHYLILLITSTGSLYIALTQRYATYKYQKDLRIFWITTTVLALIYSILMLKQFPDHDYYFLDTFYIPVMLFFILVISQLKNLTASRYFAGLVIVSILLTNCWFDNNKIQHKRKESGPWDRVAVTTANFQNSAEYLDSLGIDRNEKILVIDAYTTNIPLLLMESKGYTVVAASKENIKKSLDWNYDYVVLQDEYILSDVISVYPEILNKLERINGNGKISVYKRTDKKQELLSFIGLGEKPLLIKSKCSFNETDTTEWYNNDLYETHLKSDSYGFTGFEYPYGATYSLKSTDIFNKSRYLVFKGLFYKYNHNKSFYLVIQMQVDNETVYYESIDLKNTITKAEIWDCLYIMKRLPIVYGNCELSIYLHNPQKGRICYDDFVLEIY